MMMTTYGVKYDIAVSLQNWCSEVITSLKRRGKSDKCLPTNAYIVPGVRRGW